MTTSSAAALDTLLRSSDVFTRTLKHILVNLAEMATPAMYVPELVRLYSNIKEEEVRAGSATALESALLEYVGNVSKATLHAGYAIEQYEKVGRYVVSEIRRQNDANAPDRVQMAANAALAGDRADAALSAFLSIARERVRLGRVMALKAIDTLADLLP